jgi:inosine/xanthosine triphosphatase
VHHIRKHLLPEGGDLRFIARAVDSGVSSMPRSQEELMLGAQRRVQQLIRMLHEERVEADFFVGLEGGFYRATIDEKKITFLQGWVYVSDGRHGHFGSTGSIEVPSRIAHLVYDEHRELGDIIDDFATETDIRNKEGAFGVFSLGALTRQQSFEFAVISAFSPFYNSNLYRP